MTKYFLSLTILIIAFSCRHESIQENLIDKMITQKERSIEGQRGSSEKKIWLKNQIVILKKYFDLLSSNKNYCDSILSGFSFLLDDFSKTELELLKQGNNFTKNDIKLLRYELLNRLEDDSNRQGILSYVEMSKSNLKIGDTLNAEIGLKLVPSNSEYFSIVNNDTLKGFIPTYTEVLSSAGHFKRTGKVVYYTNGKTENYPVTFEFIVGK
jgi:hypothetical protein